MDTSIRSSVRVQKIQAIGLTVTDLDRSIIFYTQVLDFELIRDIIVTEENLDRAEEIGHSRIRIATLKLGDEQIRLMQYLDKQGRSIPEDARSNDLWFQHLAIVVSDMDRAYARLRSFEIDSISIAPQTIPPEHQTAANIQAFKFRDPDRHPLELICFPPDKGQKKWHQQTDRLFLGIDHTAIAIASTAASRQFYCDWLGMQIDGGSCNSGETQTRLDGLPAARVQITALRPIQGGMGIELLDYIEPADGRSIPLDLERYDTAYLQVEAIAKFNDLTDEQPRLIRDPTGHFLLLIADSNN
jgi:catechol 2,3-dioxygenase-like lactoylglutathione lyase family enzyme